MKKNVLYIGNALADTGKTKTTIDTLSKNLSEFCTVKISSNKSNKVLRLIDMMWHVVKYRRQSDYVLIDTYSTTNFYYAVIVAQLCRWFSLPYIPILHGGNLEYRLKNNPKLSSGYFKNAFKLVAPSKYLKTIFNTYGYLDVVYIPNTIEIKNYTYVNRDLNKINLLWVRSFSSIYNPKMAVDVLKTLKQRNIDACLTMVGPEVDGALEQTKNYAKQKEIKVTFTGLLSKKEWITLSKKHNLFINTTTIDNTPVSVIEAMALGLPIVSTKVGGIPFLIEHNYDGLLVEPNNAISMVESIIKLKDDKGFKSKLVRNARAKVEEFDWNKVKPLWESLLYKNN